MGSVFSGVFSAITGQWCSARDQAQITGLPSDPEGPGRCDGHGWLDLIRLVKHYCDVGIRYADSDGCHTGSSAGILLCSRHGKAAMSPQPSGGVLAC